MRSQKRRRQRDAQPSEPVVLSPPLFGGYNIEIGTSQVNWYDVVVNFSVADLGQGGDVEVWFEKRSATGGDWSSLALVGSAPVAMGNVRHAAVSGGGEVVRYSLRWVVGEQMSDFAVTPEQELYYLP
jgi:hypothetical protein